MGNDQTVDQKRRHKRSGIYINNVDSSLDSTHRSSWQPNHFETCGFDAEIQCERRQKRAAVFVKNAGSSESGLDSTKSSTSQPSCQPNHLEACGFDAEIQCNGRQPAGSVGQGDIGRGILHLNHLSPTAHEAPRARRSSDESIPSRVGTTLEANSKIQQDGNVQHLHKQRMGSGHPRYALDAMICEPVAHPEKKLSDKELKARRALRFPTRYASDTACEPAQPVEKLSDKELKARRALRFPTRYTSDRAREPAHPETKLSDKELKARRALRFPKQWQPKEQPDLSANVDPIQEHGIVHVATPNNPSIESAKFAEPTAALVSSNLAAASGHMTNHDSFREASCHPDELNHYARRATDSDYTYEDFQEVLKIDIDLDGLSPQPILTPSFMNYVEHNVKRLCKISTASDAASSVMTSDAPRISYAAGHMWFDKEVADDKPNKSTEKQAQSEDRSTPTKRKFLSRFCGCFRVNQEEDIRSEAIAPSA